MKLLRVGGPMDECRLDLVWDPGNVWDFEDVLNSEVGSEPELELELEVVVQLEPELATAVSLVALALSHWLVDPGVFELETVGPPADCLEESSGGGWFQGPPSGTHVRV